MEARSTLVAMIKRGRSANDRGPRSQAPVCGPDCVSCEFHGMARGMQLLASPFTEKATRERERGRVLRGRAKVHSAVHFGFGMHPSGINGSGKGAVSRELEVCEVQLLPPFANGAVFRRKKCHT